VFFAGIELVAVEDEADEETWIRAKERSSVALQKEATQNGSHGYTPKSKSFAWKKRKLSYQMDFVCMAPGCKKAARVLMSGEEKLGLDSHLIRIELGGDHDHDPTRGDATREHLDSITQKGRRQREYRKLRGDFLEFVQNPDTVANKKASKKPQLNFDTALVLSRVAAGDRDVMYQKRKTQVARRFELKMRKIMTQRNMTFTPMAGCSSQIHASVSVRIHFKLSMWRVPTSS
jgi:hypothetical protein